ncbi:MAG: hypothetical protein RIR19_669 [Chloroflexota bacterium]|jgi:prolyl-tRNA editing enzyme YbaK/EbsC (Cys-tRNA(Pro) deacylase)
MESPKMDEGKRRSFVERVVAAGAAAGVEVRPHAMGETTATAAEAAAALGVEVGQIVKSLIFATVEEPPRGVLCLLSGADRADLAALAAVVGVSSVRRASADEARAFTGFVIGGIPPFGHATHLVAVADAGLRAWEQLWAACGTHLDVFPISPAELLRASGAREAQVAERRDPAPRSKAATA